MTDLWVRGARQHNLKDVEVRIPRDRLTVIAGPSGSGKSSLAFDTIYAEGQRRYVESLSVYARQFLDQLPKPDVDLIEGLSPAIAIREQGASKNPRSTVGTVTEIYDHLRLLFARAGTPHCPECGREITALTSAQMVDRVLALPEGTRLVVQAPVARGEKGALTPLLERLRKDGYVRVVLDGEVRELGEPLAIDPKRAHDLDVQVDRLRASREARARLSDSIELALELGGGLVRIVPGQSPPEEAAGAKRRGATRVVLRASPGGRASAEREPGGRSPPEEAIEMSEKLACPVHGPVLAELTPRTFSFNGPEGACPACAGLGEERALDAERVVPDETRSIAEGAIEPWGKPGGPYHRTMVRALSEKLDVALDVAWRDLPKKTRTAVLHGKKGGYEGVLAGIEKRARDYEDRRRHALALNDAGAEAAIEFLEEELGRFYRRDVCRSCGGARLRREALAVTVGERNIHALTKLSIADARAFFDALALPGDKREIADRIVREIRARLGFLSDVGLGYLSLERKSATLSGGEAQRIRLATQIGSALVGVLYVLDEPSIGLHARDNERLIATLVKLRDVGNTVLVVEHDADTIRAADRVIDMGPGAGRLGGRVVAAGTPAEIAQNPASRTGRYLAGERLALPKRRRKARGFVAIEGARTHNLRGVTVKIPLAVLTCVTGVSGSGKSSLIRDTLLPLARAALHGAKIDPVPARLSGLTPAIDKVISIDQAPIGRTPRSNPATYTGVFAELRELFAALPEARARGYGPGRFSFNVKGGRCEACKGDGVVRVAMHFLPDVYATCTVCGGRRYDRETLEVRYRGLSIADALELSVVEALDLFEVLPKLRDRLRALTLVGLGYVQLGQPATTLSGGEAQRMKLARELARKDTGSTLYVLDEPTTGLHYGDVEVLLGALDDLVQRGNTVVVIEHDLDVIRMADHVIDLGPEGGDGGGAIVCIGTPEEVAACEGSHTGCYLARELARE
jgi:excinuclease ABC subunit A